MRCPMLLRPMEEHELAEVIGHRGLVEVLRRRLAETLPLRFLGETGMQRTTRRPALAPVIPALQVPGDALEVVDIHPVRHEPGIPVVDRDLNPLLSRHVPVRHPLSLTIQRTRDSYKWGRSRAPYTLFLSSTTQIVRATPGPGLVRRCGRLASKAIESP